MLHRSRIRRGPPHHADVAAMEADLWTFASMLKLSKSPRALALRQLGGARLYGVNAHRDGREEAQRQAPSGQAGAARRRGHRTVTN